MVANTAEAILRSRYEDGITRGLQQSLRGMHQALAVMNSGSSQAQRGFNHLRDSIQQAASAARNLLAPISAVFTAGIVGAVKLAANMETTEIGFRTMLGSAEAAQKLLSELQQFAAKTPFEFTGLVETSNRMLALGFSTKELLPTLRAVGDTAAALGGEKEKIDRIITALGQMRMKGKVSAEEMIQLAEAGVPVYDLLAKRIGVDIPQAMKLAEKGAIDANAAVNAIVLGMSERFGGRMEDMSQSLKGQFSNLLDSIKITATEIGRTFLPETKRAVEHANKLLDWAKQAATEFVKLPEPIRNTAYAIALLAAVAGTASLGITGLTAGLRNLALLTGPFAALGATAKTVAYAISHGLTGALIGLEVVLLRLVQLSPIVAAGVGGWYLGDKLQRHAQANRELNDTAKFVRELNARLKETPEWWLQRGLTPPSTGVKPSQSYEKILAFAQGLKPTTAGPAVPLIKPDAEGWKKEAERIAQEQDRLNGISRDLFLRTANDREAAILRLQDDFRKIDDLTKTDPASRSFAKRLAVEAHLQDLREINRREREEQERHQSVLADVERIGQEQRGRQMARFIRDLYLGPILAAYDAEREAAEDANRREQQRAREVSDAIGASSQLDRAIRLSRQGRISREIGSEALNHLPQMIDQLQRKIDELRSMDVINPEQIDQLYGLYEALDRLNQLDMSPAQVMMGDLWATAERMAAATTEAFGNFWADMVSGQENFGKRFLAALLDMVSKELMMRALQLTALAIAQAAMLDFAGAARYAAAAAAVSALGGVLKGYAANLTQDRQAQSQSPAASPRPSSGQQVQVIQVGAPRGAQTSGQRGPQQQTVMVEVQVKAERGFVANEVKREIRSNGQLRNIIQAV